MTKEEWIAKVQGSPLSDLPKLYKQMGPRMAQEVSIALENAAQSRVREAEYLYSRSQGAGHEQANKRQNKKIAKVRKAMGYNWRGGEDDLNITEDDDEQV